MHAPPPAPTAIAFRNASAGLLGTDRTIEASGDGGRTWRVVLRTPRPVTRLGFDPDGRPRAVLDDGENLTGSPAWRGWRRARPPAAPASPCPRYTASYLDGGWALCSGEGGAGNAAKAVYRLTPHGWRRLAYTPFPGPGAGRGGIGAGGYALGISIAPDGFGVLWESRGTLYVTRDGGSHWTGLPRVAVPEVDFGVTGWALPHGVAFVVLARGAVHRRLLETRDRGRTWRVVHRWR